MIPVISIPRSVKDRLQPLGQEPRRRKKVENRGIKNILQGAEQEEEGNIIEEALV